MKRAFLLLMLLSLTAQAGQLYKWTDKNGRVQYSDKPVASAEKVQVRGAAAATDTAAPEGDAERAARECTAKKEQLQTYQKAVRVIERDSLGKEKEFSEAERQQLIARTQQQIEQYCSGNPPPEQATAPRPSPPPVEPPLVEPLNRSEGGQ